LHEPRLKGCEGEVGVFIVVQSDVCEEAIWAFFGEDAFGQGLAGQGGGGEVNPAMEAAYADPGPIGFLTEEGYRASSS
jgi:hypothetical protein